MRITPAELDSLKTLVYATRSIALLGSFPEQDNLSRRLKKAKVAWWKKLRGNYHLPKQMKFSIELDGDLAGELRIKGSGGVPYKTPAEAVRDPDYLPPVAPQVDRTRLINSLNGVFQDLGMEAVDPLR